MAAMPIRLFVNPTAGRGRAGGSIASIRRLLDANQIGYQLTISTRAGDIKEKIVAATDAGADVLIVAGGDGCIHEAVNGVMRGRGKRPAITLKSVCHQIATTRVAALLQFRPPCPVQENSCPPAAPSASPGIA